MDFETSLLATGGEDRGNIQVSMLGWKALRDWKIKEARLCSVADA